MKRLLTLTLEGNFEQGFDATLEIRQGDIHSPSWGEFFWIWGWAMVGGLLVLVCGRLMYWLGLGIVVIGVLGGVCFVLFLQGWWVPFVPTGLAFLVTGGIMGYQKKVLKIPQMSYS